MNYQYNKPIRTYGKNKFKEVVISIPKLIISTSNDTDNKNSISLNKKLDRPEENKVDNDSMYNDPFETTFDRLLKNARIPSQAPKTYKDTISLNSSSDITFEKSDHKSQLHNKYDSNIKSNSKQKAKHRKLKLQSVKKKIVKKKVLIMSNKGKLKVEEGMTNKKFKLRKTRDNSKMTSKHSDIGKSCNFEKKDENMISSTPTGKPVRLSIYLPPLSPISTGYFKKLEDSVNKSNELMLESKLVNNDLCKNSDIVKNCEFEDELNILSSYSTNISDFNRCNLDPSENIDKRNTNPLTVHSYIGNNNHSKKELLTEKSLVQNISRNGTTRDNELEKSVLTQEHIISNIEKDKHHLRFSFDTNGSHSLFDDTGESIQILSHNTTETNDIAKVSISNLVVDEKNIVLNTELHFNSDKLNKKSTLNTNNDKTITLNETKEEFPEDLNPIILAISDAKSDNIEFRTEVKEVNDKSNGTIDVPEKILLNESNVLNPCVVLKRLQDSITKKRKYTKWDLDLFTISEDYNDSTKLKKEQTHLEKTNKDGQVKFSKIELPCLENIIEESTNNACVTLEKPVYLKSGKSWARSLSILNNIQTEFNLDKLSIGKGKKWRHSVQDILNMQKQGIIQSCIKKDDNDKELQVNNEIINKSEHESSINKGRTCDSTNLGRISRRISVRVVPIQKTIKFIEDASFLEVYGIVPVKSQRFTLLNDPRKSSTCNVQNDDIDGQIIEEHIVSTAREVILQRCSQEDYIPFSIYFSESYLEHCRKIGEGVYGEVFLYEQENKRSVIKIIPIEGNDYVNGEPQKKFHEILSEIVIAMELHNLRFNTRYNTDGFVEVKNIKCIKGKYPEKLIELWNIYDEEKRSDNDSPSMFNDDQLYIVLELGHGGQDLEAFVFNTAEEAYILFIQAALALAVAEKAIEFEHRDLHWGNILISETNESYVYYKLGQKNIELISKGVKVSIIDFTLSRVKYQGCSIFNDLASDPTLFTAQGEYQFEIYRLMRDKVMNNWQKFEPYTNVLWLHYILDKMITAVRYRKKNLKSHKNGIIKLKKLKDEILTYNSAFDFITNCDKIVDLLRTNSKSAITSV